MNFYCIKRLTIVALLYLFLASIFGFAPEALAGATVIRLTQLPCQFLESENGLNWGYQSKSMSDCEAINVKTGEQRLSAAKTLSVKPGPYIFRITNKNVPYELGFWLRGAGVVARASLPSVSAGGLTSGKTQD